MTPTTRRASAPTLSLSTSEDTLQFDAASGRLVALVPRATENLNLIVPHKTTPVFAIQYLDEHKRLRELVSGQAASTTVDVQQAGERRRIVATFERIAGIDLGVTATVEASEDERLSYWWLEVRNSSGLQITSVQYPVVIAPYALGVDDHETALVWPVGAGVLMRNPRPQDLQPDSPYAWHMSPENTAVLHNPGFITAQFMAYYGKSAGIYMASQDDSGYIKLLKPVHRHPGLRLGIAHVGDWPGNGERALEYAVVLGSFSGDWYDAADLYRGWARRQHWCQVPLRQRNDVPDWLIDSPAHLMVRMQGELDHGPAEPNTQFLPYPKILPLLEDVSSRIAAPVLPVLMSWERGGPWVYPDCFPPIGADSLPEFTSGARERGLHVGTFSNGTRWVVGHRWSGYDGTDFFDAHNAEQGVSRLHTGAPWKEQWDAHWRPSYACCLGARQTLDVAKDYVQRVIDYGIDWIQFLDQNVGACTFPCYSDDHGHPPAPGRWMTEAMLALAEWFRQKQEEMIAASKGGRQLVFSVEGPVTEFFIPYFQICDVRVVPPGNEAVHPWWQGFIPLYHFLYHEYILIQGGFGHGADPHHLAIRNAYNLVVGEIPGAVLTGDGQLLNKDSPEINWAPWNPPLGDNDEALAVLRSALSMRRGPGKPYLVYGRMLKGARVETQTLTWQHDRRIHEVPAVFHAAWQDENGHFALILANWSREPQTVTVHDSRLRSARHLHVATPERVTTRDVSGGQQMSVEIPALSCALLEAASASGSYGS